MIPSVISSQVLSALESKQSACFTRVPAVHEINFGSYTECCYDSESRGRAHIVDICIMVEPIQ